MARLSDHVDTALEALVLEGIRTIVAGEFTAESAVRKVLRVQLPSAMAVVESLPIPGQEKKARLISWFYEYFDRAMFRIPDDRDQHLRRLEMLRELMLTSFAHEIDALAHFFQSENALRVIAAFQAKGD